MTAVPDPTPTPAPYGDRSPAPAAPERRSRNASAAALSVVATLAVVGALVGTALAVQVVASAPEGGGVDFRLLPRAAAAIAFTVAAITVGSAAGRATRA